MAILNCNCAVNSYADKDGQIRRTFNIYVSTDKHEEANAENLSVEDLIWLRRELSRSINFEKRLRNGNNEHDFK